MTGESFPHNHCHTMTGSDLAETESGLNEQAREGVKVYANSALKPQTGSHPGYLTGFVHLTIVTTLTVVPLVIYSESEYPAGPAVKFPFFMAGASLLGILWWFGLLRGKPWHRWDTYSYALTGFMIYICVRNWFDDLSSHAWFGAMPMLGGMLWSLILAGVVRNEEWTVNLLRTTLYAVVPVVVYAVGQIFHYDFFWEWYYQESGRTWSHEWLRGWQVYSSFGNPNYLAGYIGPWLLLTPAIYASCRSRESKRVVLVLAGVVLVILVRTYARGIWFSLLLGTAVFLWSSGLWREWDIAWESVRRRFWIGLGGFAAILYVVSVAADPMEWMRQFYSGFLLHDNSIRARLLLAVLTSNLWLQAPWFGLGTNRFACRMYDELVQLNSGPYGEGLREFTGNLTTLRYNLSHNEYMQTLMEWGVIGLALLLLVFAMVLEAGLTAHRRHRSSDQNRYLIPSLLGAFVTAVFHLTYDFPLHLAGASMILWTIAGLLVGLSRGTEIVPVSRTHRMLRAMGGAGGAALAVALVYFAAASMCTVYLMYHGNNNRLGGERYISINDRPGATLYFSEAKRLLDRAKRLQPENGEIDFLLGLAYLYSDGTLGGERNLQRARDRLELAARTFHPPHFDFHLAYLQFELGQNGRAVDSLKRLLILNPRYRRAHYMMGLIYYNTRRFYEAVGEFRLELAVNPEDKDALKYLGETQFLLNDLAGAEKTFQRLKEVNEWTAFAYERLGDIYATPGPRYDPLLARNNFSYAFVIFGEAVKRNPGDVTIRQDMERIAAKMKGLPESETGPDGNGLDVSPPVESPSTPTDEL